MARRSVPCDIYFMEVDEYEVLRLLSGLRECARHVERGVAEHPLDEIDVGLLALAEHAEGTLRPSEAAEALGVAFPSITRHVKGLQHTGHLAIDPDPADRRSYRIVLTEAGNAMLRDFRTGLVRRFTPVIEDWTPAEVAVLADGLAKLASAMAKVRDTPAPASGPNWWRPSTPTSGRTS